MWNAVYPYLLTVSDGEQVNTLRYATYGEAVEEYMRLLSKPVEGVNVRLETESEAKSLLAHSPDFVAHEPKAALDKYTSHD